MLGLFPILLVRPEHASRYEILSIDICVHFKYPVSYYGRVASRLSTVVFSIHLDPSKMTSTERDNTFSLLVFTLVLLRGRSKMHMHVAAAAC